jgi:hypothetical protein
MTEPLIVRYAGISYLNRTAEPALALGDCED